MASQNSSPTPEPTSLDGMTCRICKFVAYPRQSFGCEQCGAHNENLKYVRLTGGAQVVSAVAVNLPQYDDVHQGVVASMLLAEGPFVYGFIDAHKAPQRGSHVKAFSGYEIQPMIRFRSTVVDEDSVEGETAQ